MKSSARNKRPVPFQPKRLVAPRTGVGGTLTIEGETCVQGPDTRTEAATQYQEDESPEAPEEAVPVPQPTPEKLISLWAMSGEISLPHLATGTGPQFAIQAPPLNAGRVRASTTPAVKRLPGITEPGDGRPKSGRKSALPPYFVKSSVEDVERLPAIHPSVWSSRGEKKVEYRGFVSAPPVTDTPPHTAARGGRHINNIPLKRTAADKKTECDVTAPCWKCAMRLDHSKCETTKYIRIGGGFRHSYWFVQEMIARAEREEQKRNALRRRAERKIFVEKLMWRVGADGKRERRIKTFVRTKSGRKLVKYQYVPEEVFEDMVGHFISLDLVL